MLVLAMLITVLFYSSLLFGVSWAAAFLVSKLFDTQNASLPVQIATSVVLGTLLAGIVAALIRFDPFSAYGVLALGVFVATTLPHFLIKRIGVGGILAVLGVVAFLLLLLSIHTMNNLSRSW